MSRFWDHFNTNGGAARGKPGRRSRGGRGYLGLYGRSVPVTAKSARAHGQMPNSGVEVLAVESGGPAEQAGLCRGDIIVALAQQRTSGIAGLGRLLTVLPVGVPVLVTFMRGARILERLIVPDENPTRGMRV